MAVCSTLQRPAIFFDRDGVLNVNAGYISRPDEFEWCPGAVEAVRTANELGFYVFVVTNQSGIGRGLFTEEAVEALHNWMQAQLHSHGARVDAFEYAAYYALAQDPIYRQNESRRKPNPGMILDIIARYPVDIPRSVLIGDRPSDLEAADRAGIRGVLYGGGSVLTALGPFLF